MYFKKEMSDDVEELKRRLEKQIEAMIHFPCGPNYRSKEKYASQIFACCNQVYILHGNVFLIPQVYVRILQKSIWNLTESWKEYLIWLNRMQFHFALELISDITKQEMHFSEESHLFTKQSTVYVYMVLLCMQV